MTRVVVQGGNDGERLRGELASLGFNIDDVEPPIAHFKREATRPSDLIGA
jgi:hypothetical protein